MNVNCGLKNFSEKECNFMIGLIDHSLKNKDYAFKNVEGLLKFKAKLLTYLKINYKKEIRIPAKIDRSSF